MGIGIRQLLVSSELSLDGGLQQPYSDNMVAELD